MIDPQIKMKRGMKFVCGDASTVYTWAHDGNAAYGHERAVYSLIRPSDDDKEAWARFLPDAPLADTGAKAFKVGQAWACCCPLAPGQRLAVVFRVTKVFSNGSIEHWPLAGTAGINGLDAGSPLGRHSVFLFDAPAESNQPAIPESCFVDPVHPAIAGLDKLIEGVNRTVPRGKDLDCTAHACDRLRALGPYANRAGLCTMHVAQWTGEQYGLTGSQNNNRWADDIRREMRNRPEPTLIVGGLVSPLRRDEGWRKR